MQYFYNIDVNKLFNIKRPWDNGISIAIAKGDEIETYCSGSGRLGQDFPVNPDMLFQAGSVSKPMFALTVLRYVDKGIINLDADISDVLSDFVDFPITFPALLSHTAGFNVHGFAGYRAKHKPLSLEDVITGRGNSPKVRQTMPYGKQFCYSGGGITLDELAFTRLTNTSLREAFEKEVAIPLGLKRSGYFQPLDEELVPNAAFGGMLGLLEDRKHGYHYYPEHAAAGFWTTPTELVKIGVAVSRSVREDGLLCKETAQRMTTPILDNVGLSIFIDKDIPNLAGHSGWNCGFLTMWGFSLTKDISVAAMVNRSTRSTSKNLSNLGSMLFAHAMEHG